jgi:hypothetical protein
LPKKQFPRKTATTTLERRNPTELDRRNPNCFTSKLLHENVVESPREAQGKQEDQAKAAERFADWFLMDFGIRG